MTDDALEASLMKAHEEIQRLLSSFDAGKILREGVDTVIAAAHDPNDYEVGKRHNLPIVRGRTTVSAEEEWFTRYSFSIPFPFLVSRADTFSSGSYPRSSSALGRGGFTSGIEAWESGLPVGIHREAPVVVLGAHADFQRFCFQINPMASVEFYRLGVHVQQTLDRGILQGAADAAVERVPYMGEVHTVGNLKISYVPQDPSFLKGTLAEFEESRGNCTSCPPSFSISSRGGCAEGCRPLPPNGD